uniref:Uncharacterized protein n=1 Tax=Quercus lobata TaxID=97700 RepID=A0A7N2LU29_QUELO
MYHPGPWIISRAWDLKKSESETFSIKVLSTTLSLSIQTSPLVASSVATVAKHASNASVNPYQYNLPFLSNSALVNLLPSSLGGVQSIPLLSLNFNPETIHDVTINPRDFRIPDNDIIIKEIETLYLNKPFRRNTTPQSDGQVRKEAKNKDEEMDCCPVCNIDLGCLPVEKLRLCNGGELLDRILSSDENSPLKGFDFGLSDYVKPDGRLNDIVGSAYCVASEVLHRSYADRWRIGVILLILFYVEAGLFGPRQNLASSEFSSRQIQALVKPLGHLCLLIYEARTWHQRCHTRI